MSHSFQYDDLYRLTKAEGKFEYRQGRFHTYKMEMAYDGIHNITHKTQVHNIEGGNKIQAQRGTTYDWTYDYAGQQPHAPTHIGDRGFTYDANGNQLGWKHDSKGTRRNIVWDDENRVMEIQDPSNTLRFKYDAGGQRIIKEGQQGRTVYVNQYYVVKNGATVSKHIFAGTTRLATALVHGEKADRVGRSGNTSGGTANSTQDPSKAKSSKGKSKPTNGNSANSNGKGAGKNKGKGLEHRSDTANEHAQNTVKNPNLTGTLPRQAGAHRSENSQAKDVEHNPHLQGEPPTDPTDPWVTDKGSLKITKFMYFYHPDHLGSTSYVTDGNGALYEHVAYFPFGESWVTETRNGNNIDYLFTSKELDSETGLYYYGARYYDPRTSVFIGVDPADRFSPDSPSISLNLFQYTLWNPVRLVDPDGRLEAENQDGVIIYTVTKGDWLSKIAKQTGNTTQGIMNYNPQITDPDNINPGDTLNIPSNAGMERFEAAFRHMGETGYAKSASLVSASGRTFKAGKFKCNAFVGDVNAEAGLSNPLQAFVRGEPVSNSSAKGARLSSWPALANTWGDSSLQDLQGYGITTSPRTGDIFSAAATNPNHSGHVGIYTGGISLRTPNGVLTGNRFIAAGKNVVNAPTISSFSNVGGHKAGVYRR